MNPITVSVLSGIVVMLFIGFVVGYAYMTLKLSKKCGEWIYFVMSSVLIGAVVGFVVFVALVGGNGGCP